MLPIEIFGGLITIINMFLLVFHDLIQHAMALFL